MQFPYIFDPPCSGSLGTVRVESNIRSSKMYKLLSAALLLSVTGLANAALIKIDLTDEEVSWLNLNS